MAEELIHSLTDYMQHVDNADSLFIAPTGRGRATKEHQRLLKAALAIVAAHGENPGVSRVLCGYSQERQPMVFVASHELGVFVREMQGYTFEYFDLNGDDASLTIVEDGDDHYQLTYRDDPYWCLFGRGKNVAVNTFLFLMRVNPALIRQHVVDTNLATALQEPEFEQPTLAAQLILRQSPDQIGIVANPLYLYQFKDGRVGFDRIVDAPRYALLGIDIDRNSKEVSDKGTFVGYVAKRMIFGRSADIQRNISKLHKHEEDISTVVVTIRSAAGVRIRLRTELNEYNAPRFDEFVFADPTPAPAPIVVQAAETKPSGNQMTLDDIALLKQLAALAEAGVLTQAEFAAKKKQILGI